MDRKSIIILVACFVLFLLWMQLIPKLAPPIPASRKATNGPEASVTGTATNAPGLGLAEGATMAASTSAPPVFTLPTAQERLLEVTNENARYLFTSYGGGLKSIELYPKSATRRPRGGATATNGIATFNTQAPVPILTVLAGEGFQGDGIFELTRTATGVRAQKTLTNGLALVKDFQLGTNYLLSATVRLQNNSVQPIPLTAQEWVIGTATPMGPDDSGQAVGVIWYDGSAAHSEANRAWFDNTSFLGCLGLAARQPRTEYRQGASNVVWVAVQNQFFALAAMPKEPAPQVVARPLDLPRPASWLEHARTKNAPLPKGFQTAIVYPATTLAAGETLERQITLFCGPKEYSTLAHIAVTFGNNLDLIMGFAGVFGFFAKALLLSMNWLHDLLGLGYGWVIILITFIIKLYSGR